MRPNRFLSKNLPSTVAACKKKGERREPPPGDAVAMCRHDGNQGVVPKPFAIFTARKGTEKAAMLLRSTSSIVLRPIADPRSDLETLTFGSVAVTIVEKRYKDAVVCVEGYDADTAFGCR